MLAASDGDLRMSATFGGHSPNSVGGGALAAELLIAKRVLSGGERVASIPILSSQRAEADVNGRISSTTNAIFFPGVSAVPS
jgi:hypothetical protein